MLQQEVQVIICLMLLYLPADLFMATRCNNNQVGLIVNPFCYSIICSGVAGMQGNQYIDLPGLICLYSTFFKMQFIKAYITGNLIAQIYQIPAKLNTGNSCRLLQGIGQVIV
ncbi:hypothetical protein D3C86_1802510 [compost metagenome]